MKKIRYAFYLLLCMQFAQAQTNVYNFGQVFITNSSDTVFITGSLTNNAGADLNNAGGNLYVKKDLTNYQVNMTTGAGKLWTTGTATQTFYGTQNFRTYDWVVDNPSNITLTNRVEVGDGTGGSLSFINGKITSGFFWQDVFFNANSSYTGFSDNNHIVGFCSKAGNTNFTYPIGNGVLKADLDIANLGTSSVFQCKYYGNIYSSLALTAPLASVFDKEYWILDRTAGISGSNITLKWNDARNALNHLDPSGIRVGHFTGSSWISEAGTGSGNTATGAVTSTMVNSFSPFTFASQTIILPVLVSSYNVAVNANCDAVINWKSFEDGASKQYILQKLINNSWTNLNNVSAKAFGENSYSLIDFNAEKGINAYRVATELHNGTNYYTAVKSVNISCKKNAVKIYPTITKSIINVSLPEDAQIFITNNNGQIVSEMILAKAGTQTLSLSPFAKGIYIITVKTATGATNIKVVKE